MDWLKRRITTVITPSNTNPPWQALIVDDDLEVHTVTKLVMKDFEFEGRKVSFDSVYSGEAAIQQVTSGPEYALILLDVVMETDDAGLNVAKYIRQDLHNNYSRIVLRTGQPGMAPEKDVIRTYEIDGYANKTELNKQALSSIFYTSLRSYRDICSLKSYRKSLETVVRSISSLNSINDLFSFASAVLQQITSVLGDKSSDLIIQGVHAYAASKFADNIILMAASENGIKVVNDFKLESLKPDIKAMAEKCFREKSSFYEAPMVCHYHKTDRGFETVLIIKSHRPLLRDEERLIELFASNVVVTYENLVSVRDQKRNFNTLVSRVCGAIDGLHRAGVHAKQKVGRYAALLAQHAGQPEEFVDHIALAAQLHDVGNLEIDPNILCKKEPLSDKDWKEIKRHPALGADILFDESDPILIMAHTIALQHQENWNGSGYPQKLDGEAIDLAARITAIADVFDSLTNNRPYRQALTPEEAIDTMRSISGKRFDPTLFAVFLHHQDEFISIHNKPHG